MFIGDLYLQKVHMPFKITTNLSAKLSTYKEYLTFVIFSSLSPNKKKRSADADRFFFIAIFARQGYNIEKTKEETVWNSMQSSKLRV